MSARTVTRSLSTGVWYAKSQSHDQEFQTVIQLHRHSKATLTPHLLLLN